MATPAQIADYYDGYPDPDDPRTWGLRPSGVRNHSFSEAQAAWEAEHGDAPEPEAVPGPPTPGAGMAAARAGDTTAHGGTIGPVTTGQVAQVFIGNKPAACMGDPHVCPMFSGPKPHVGGTITKGSATVYIGGKFAARVADLTVCTSEPGQVATGELSVLIGDLAGSGTAGAGGGNGGNGNANGSTDESQSGGASDSDVNESSERPPGESVQEFGTGTHWISIELVDEARQPVVGEPYRITLPDGRAIGGALDGKGQARINGLEEPGYCRISFPKLDLDAWQRSFDAGSAPFIAPAGASPPTRDATDPVSAGSAQPTGRWHQAGRDDCISSIAFASGLFWHTIWEHSANEPLRQARANPNVLQDGDNVFVPAVREKNELGGTDRHHRFVRRGEPAHLQLRVLDEDQPRSNVPWTLEVDGQRFEGHTDGDGNLSVPLLGGTRSALLRVGPPDDEDEYELDLGAVAPVTVDAGVRARLENLGHLDPDRHSDEDDLSDALREFQQQHGLAITGVADEATQTRLLMEHGS